MTMELEAVNCRRFLQAWARFRDAEAPQRDVETLYQYQLMAQHFQELVDQSGAGGRLKEMEGELAPVLQEIERLASEEDDELARFRVPALTRRHTRKKAARLSPRSAERLTREADEAAETQAPEGAGSLSADRPEGSVSKDWELDAREFETMLDTPPAREEKLTTRALRKRLGHVLGCVGIRSSDCISDALHSSLASRLVDRAAGERQSASEAVAQAEQEALQSEMAELAQQLKERTQTINQSLVDDVKILDAVGESAESNAALLDRENKVLEKQLASSIGLWTTLWLIAMVAVVFVVMYLFMKVFGRRW